MMMTVRSRGSQNKVWSMESACTPFQTRLANRRLSRRILDQSQLGHTHVR